MTRFFGIEEIGTRFSLRGERLGERNARVLDSCCVGGEALKGLSTDPFRSGRRGLVQATNGFGGKNRILLFYFRSFLGPKA